jgi:hypothetical protein
LSPAYRLGEGSEYEIIIIIIIIIKCIHGAVSSRVSSRLNPAVQYELYHYDCIQLYHLENRQREVVDIN